MQFFPVISGNFIPVMTWLAVVLCAWVLARAVLQVAGLVASPEKAGQAVLASFAIAALTWTAQLVVAIGLRRAPPPRP